ncbi:hypothetical protein GA0115240_172015 [Streptomyces sp. DvalAA-14]|uniref:toxin-antitoxin system YwqK family antitoxin n=1 Tax=unclassified Streptomyces TaxID=2593676 RepID=UPI00081BC49E|nr:MULTISPECIES: hypothetical protein [unclassified Streptomyces]MYS24960.1 hypothetical protein [Streptomyces sp. SID4948]SCE50929.1 hypothetical protein GA0115240_172015 [Streptomyces sp. DvalAA-14]
MTRVNVDDPELDAELDQSVTYQGRLFTGETYEENPRTRVVVAETTYRDGLEDGPTRGWYPDGEIEFEGTVERGLPKGVWRSWHRNGRLAEEKEFGGRQGGVVALRRWSEDGELVEERTFGD